MTDEKKDALAVPSGLADMIVAERPGGRDEGDIGNEGIGRDDVLMPRLALAQKTSPELDPTNTRYIEGVKFTDLFNSLTAKNYGQGPIYFVVLRADRPRWVEFKPLAEGGGIVDPNVPANDPRTQFGQPDASGKSAKPVATKFYDFIVLMLNDFDANNPLQNVVGLSFKSTGIKAAKHLNLLINQRGQKRIYKGLYELRSDSAANVNGTFAIYKVKNAGWLKPGSDVEKLAAEMYEGLKERTVNIDRGIGETDDEVGDTDFPHGANAGM